MQMQNLSTLVHCHVPIANNHWPKTTAREAQTHRLLEGGAKTVDSGLANQTLPELLWRATRMMMDMLRNLKTRIEPFVLDL